MDLNHLWLYFFVVLLDLFTSMTMTLIALPIFIVVIIPLFIIFCLVQRFYIAASRQFERLESKTRSQIYSKFSETLAGISQIRAYGASDRQANASVDDNVSCSLCRVSSTRWLSTRLQFIGNLAVFFSGVFAVINRSTVDRGLIALSIVYSMDISYLLNWLIQQISWVEMDMVAVERVLEYSNNESEAECESGVSEQPSPTWPEAGDISLKSFSTRHRPGLDLVLNDITAHISTGGPVNKVHFRDLSFAVSSQLQTSGRRIRMQDATTKKIRKMRKEKAVAM